MYQMADFYDFNSTFWLSLTTMVFGFGGACLAYGLRSKCSNIKLCYGCVDVTRDIDAEVELEETMGQQPISPVLEQPANISTRRSITPPISRISFNRSMMSTKIQKELSNDSV